MKTLLLGLALAALLLGCKKDNPQRILDPNATISIRPANGVTLKSTNPEHLSAYEIVKRATVMSVRVHNNDFAPYRGFSDEQRDLEGLRLLFFGIDVIYENKVTTYWLESYDIVLQEWTINGVNWDDYVGPDPTGKVKKDTIAYIPNATVRAASLAINAAFERGDYDECYRLFDDAFRFIPITGEEWRALKAEDRN